MTKYKHTHESIRDGSPAMLVTTFNDGDLLLLTNEDGYEWRDPAWRWAPVGTLSVERCETCGQPDNCGDCNHEPMSWAELIELVR